MQPYRSFVTLFLAICVLTSSCVSRTMINSDPSGAEIYIDNQKVGITPFQYGDTKPSGARTAIKLKKEGYKDLYITLVRDEQVEVGAIIAGIFVLIPFIWTMKYYDQHTYSLEALQPTTTTIVNENSTKELLKLKELLDTKAITENDFLTIKTKILNNKYDYSKSIVDQIQNLKQLKDASILTEAEYNDQKYKLINAD
jgi:hypothetical protein